MPSATVPPRAPRATTDHAGSTPLAAAADQDPGNGPGKGPDHGPDRGPDQDRGKSPEADRRAHRLLLQAVCDGSGWTVLIAVTGIVGALAETALPAVLGRSLDALLHDGPHGPLLLCIALLAVLTCCQVLEQLAVGAGVARATGARRHALIRHVLALGPAATYRFPAGDLVSRVVGSAAETGSAPVAVVWSATSLITPVGSLVALALIDPWLPAAFLLGAPLLVLLLRAFVHESSDVAIRYQRAQGDIAARFVEALTGARTVAAAGTVDHEIQRVLAPLPGLAEQGAEMWRSQATAAARAALLVPLLQIAVVVTAGIRLSHGRITVGEMLAAGQYALLAVGFGAAVGQLSGLARARGGAYRMAEVLAVRPPGYGDRPLPEGPGLLEFRGVTVRRRGSTVLAGVDLTVPGGAVLAIVGRSGSGKSLLAAIAGRLSDPDAGEVRLDGVPLGSLTEDQLRAAVGYAFARPALLGGSIAEAVSAGPCEVTPEQLREATRAACADDFVRRLPDGYRTSPADAPLSGGERQRLGLARALLHPGRLLVLDDATSSLDTVTEMQVTRALTRSRPTTTRLVVAHRAGTAARADLVAWLDGGRVRSVGTHRALWADPEYRAIFDRPTDRSADGRLA